MTRQEAIDKVYGMSGTKEQHEALEFLVPEIRELRKFYDRQQEDKRIRKELVEAFEALDIDSSWNGIPVKSILAWLEKQKEHQELPLMNGDADLYFDTWRQEVPVPTFRQCFEEGMRYAQRLQKEQKPIDYEAELKKCKDNPLYFYDKYVSIKQKPAEWSEEEYGRLFDIEHYLDGTLQLSPDRKIACIDFLKSLYNF